MFTLAQTANQVNDPLLIGVVLAIALVVVGYVLYGAFSAKPNPKARFQHPRREKHHTPASASGRFR